MTRAEAARLLGVEADAAQRDVRAAFRTLARRAHPDASDGGNPALLSAAKDARDILLGTLEPEPEVLPEPPFVAHGHHVEWEDRRGTPTVDSWDPVRSERRWGRFLLFVGFLAMLLVGAVIGVLVVLSNTAQELQDLVPSAEESPTTAPANRNDECVQVQLTPADVLPVGCDDPDAQRIVAVFGGQVDCPLDLNALYVARQTWCLQPAADADVPIVGDG